MFLIDMQTVFIDLPTVLLIYIVSLREYGIVNQEQTCKSILPGKFQDGIHWVIYIHLRTYLVSIC